MLLDVIKLRDAIRAEIEDVKDQVSSKLLTPEKYALFVGTRCGLETTLRLLDELSKQDEALAGEETYDESRIEISE